MGICVRCKMFAFPDGEELHVFMRFNWSFEFSKLELFKYCLYIFRTVTGLYTARSKLTYYMWSA